MPRRPSIPSYRLHKATGQAIVTIAGRDFYLGPYGSPQSTQAYNRLVAEWLSGSPPTDEAVDPIRTVSEVLDAYHHHCAVYYRRPDGSTTSQLARVVYALGPVRDLYGDTPAGSFGPRALKAVREHLIRGGLCRRYVNSLVGCVKRCFKWAAAEELVSPSIYHGLLAVEGLKAGRTEARESAPVRPVPQADVDAVEPHVLRPVWDLIRFQLLTGARPGEALVVAPGLLDRSGTVWRYRVEGHKTAYCGHQRVILIGPRCQQVLDPYLDRAPELPCFSPREAVEQYQRDRGQTPRHAKNRTPGDSYTIYGYDRAIAKGCRRAGVTPWHPHQLRHNAATFLVAEFGWDVARVILGHRSLDATRIYGEDNLKRAAEVIARVG